MPVLSKSKKLKKELRLIDIYAIATGTTLSAGFFLLPGLAAQEAGPALVAAYLLAAVPLIPAMFSIAELATAMPRAGGVYYFLDRSLGPMSGTIGGVGTWLALILKVAFALIGMGAYISLFVEGASITLIAVIIAIILGAMNILSVKGSSKLQIVLVAVLLIILFGFVGGGIPNINPGNFKNFFSSGVSKILSTTGMVYISYVGLTKVASLSEEVKDPEKNIPRGIFLALGTAFIIYSLGTVVMVGLIPMNELKGDLTPVATGAGKIFGYWGIVLVTIAALFAFISVANAGTMSASRYPFAMSRDRMFPHLFQRLNKKGIPVVAILLTVTITILIVVFFDPAKIAKLASAFQLLMFALVCLAVIVMRESRIHSYDPGYKSPLYPWMQILGIIAPLILIGGMGMLTISFSVGLVMVGVMWYHFYARNKVIRAGAIYHVFERLGRARYNGLDSELREILKEKGLREADPFDEIVARSFVINVEKKAEFEEMVEAASQWISQVAEENSETISKIFLDGTRMGATPVMHKIALPHLKLKGIQQAEMVLVRAKEGVHIKFKNPLTDFKDDEDIVNAIFFLVSPEDDPTQHLRILAQIAGRVEEENFITEWTNAADDQEIKEVLLRDERLFSIVLDKHSNSSSWIGLSIKEIKIPPGCLVALLRRNKDTIIPAGNTVFEDGDRLTIIGNPEGLNELRKKFIENN